MRIELHGQPIVGLRQGVTSPIGTEVLFRMPGTDMESSVSPVQYLSACTQPIMPLFMDATVMGSLLAGGGESIAGQVFLNVCPETLEGEGAFSVWLAGLEVLCERRAPNSVVVEIPESCSLPSRQLKRRLDDISGVGALLALDDYPAGQFSDVLLHAHSWDYVKICVASTEKRGLTVGEVIDKVAAVRPQSIIIGERFNTELAQWASMVKGVSLFQSFDLGLPAPLELTRKGGALALRQEPGFAVHRRATAI